MDKGFDMIGLQNMVVKGKDEDHKTIDRGDALLDDLMRDNTNYENSRTKMVNPSRKFTDRVETKWLIEQYILIIEL